MNYFNYKYSPRPNLLKEKFNKQEQLLLKKGEIVAKTNKSFELFLLNDFVTGIRDNQHIPAILQKIYGMGFTRSFQISIIITYSNDIITFKRLTKRHCNLISDLLDKYNFCLKNWLYYVKKINIAVYKASGCYRGDRHSKYLPVRGQRTQTNAHVARYIGSGTFEYVPKTPGTKKNKKLSKYSRRKPFLVLASNSRFQRLLNKSFIEYVKKNKKKFKQLVKKNKLGVFTKLFKEKQKLKKAKLKLLKKSKK